MPSCAQPARRGASAHDMILLAQEVVIKSDYNVAIGALALGCVSTRVHVCVRGVFCASLRASDSASVCMRVRVRAVHACACVRACGRVGMRACASEFARTE